MKCPRCHHDNPQGARFCEECATLLARTCSNCGTALSATAKFCHACAHPVAAAADTPSRSPESYTPKHLAEKILTSKTALEGERKQVTVLFADLKGSMELLADRDPEVARKILDPVLERMMEAVHRYEGTVNQVMGDGIMALFGAPVAHEDHAVRACYAALRMQEAVKQYADEVRRTAGVRVLIRTGLNSGEVVVRSIGSDMHMDYTAVGQTTHLAARMEQLTDPGAILLTADTLRLAEGFVRAQALGAVRVKGLEAPVECFELIGASSTRSRLQAAAARGLTKFVGRDGELIQLHQALEQAKAGQGQIVAVVGEPGVGKSRLLWEFLHSYRTQGCLVLEASSVSYGRATSYLPVIDLLKGFFQIEAGDDARKVREKITGKVLSLEESLKPILPAMLSLLHVALEEPAWQKLDPSQRRRRILDGVKGLLLRESRVQPVVVLFEDLHWVDGETQAVLEGLAESLPTARLLLLVNYRPEYQHAWGSKTYYRQLRIDALSARSAEHLLAALLGGDASLVTLKALLVERTEGNPFFLEESVRTLIETGALVGERGAYRLTTAPMSLQIPPTAQVVLAARIDRLSPEDKYLLQTAAVIGKDIPLPLLQAVADIPEEALRAALARLQAAEFLYETRLFPDLELTFKHALTHEVAYAGLLHERRRAIHLKIVEAIGRLDAKGLDEDVERLAHHAMRGESWNDAVGYFRRAGAKAMARSANRGAAASLEQALLALDHLPESGATVAQMIDVHFELRNALWPLGEPEKVLDHLNRARTLAERCGDERRLTHALVYLAHYSNTGGDHGKALASGAKALAAATALGDSTLELQARLRLGQIHRATGDYRAGAVICREVIDSLEGVEPSQRFGLLVPPFVFARTILISCLSALGDFGEGAARAHEALSGAKSVGHPYTLIHAYTAAGSLYAGQGEFARAIPILEEAVSLCETGHFPVLFPGAAAALGSVYATHGRVGDGVRLLEKALDEARTTRMLQDYPHQSVRVAETYLIAGRLSDAAASATRGLTLARKGMARGAEAAALRLLGVIALHQEPPDFSTSHARYREALEMADELGMRPLVAHCHLGLCKLYRRTDKREQAQEHLATATTMYREMGMTYWLEKAEAEIQEMG